MDPALKGRGGASRDTHKGYVAHLFRESIREHQPGTLEERRVRTFGGIGAQLDRVLTLLALTLCAPQ